MLDFDSFNALHDEPSASKMAIRPEPNLTQTASRDLRSRAMSYLCSDVPPIGVDSR